MGMEFWLMFILGFCFGLLGAVVYQQSKTMSGTLKIDHSDPEKDMYLFEIDDLDKLDKKTRVYLKVDHSADLSQK